jgi:hypothetical protein
MSSVRSPHPHEVFFSRLRRAGCRDATPVASTCEGQRTGGGARPSTLLAQVRYVVPDVAIESLLNMESDGLKAARFPA